MDRIYKREQRWVKEDAEREEYRKQYSKEVSAEKLAQLLEIWARDDRRRVEKRVNMRKKDNDPPVPDRIQKLRDREDARIQALHLKQDAALVEKRKMEDLKLVAKRKAEEHLIYLKRCEQAVKLNERRKEEDERHGLSLHDLVDGLVRLDRLASGPGTEC
jgi:hypothetical protein